MPWVSYGRKFTVSGEVPVERTIKCDRCGYVYPYHDKIHIHGEGDSLLWLDNNGAQQRAHQRASDDLSRQMATIKKRPILEKCPSCNMYSLVETERRISSRRKSWILAGFVFGVTAGGIVATSTGSTVFGLMAIAAVLGICLIIGTGSYDPNK